MNDATLNALLAQIDGLTVVGQHLRTDRQNGVLGVGHDTYRTALTVWEEMLAIREREPPAMSDFQAAWTIGGTCAMRGHVEAIARWANDVWARIPEDKQPVPFDWEFIPAVLRYVDWSNGYPDMPTAGTVAALIIGDTNDKGEVGALRAPVEISFTPDELAETIRALESAGVPQLSPLIAKLRMR